MKSLLPFDSSAVKLGYKMGTLVTVNLLWLICCIPVVTIGASTAAMYRVVLDMCLEKESKSTSRRFFQAFRSDFKQATLVWLILLIPVLLILFNLGMLLAGQLTGTIMYIVCLIPVPLLLFILSYGFAYTAMFEDSPIVTIKNSMIISIRNLPKSLLIVILNILPALAFAFFNEAFIRLLFVWIMFAFALIAYIDSKLILRAFDPYLPKKEEADEA